MRFLLPLLVMVSVVKMQNVDEELMKQSLYYGLVATASKASQYGTCKEQMAMTANGIINNDRWAVKMLDSSGSPGSGLHYGNTFWLGNGRQCESTMIVKSLPISPNLGPATIETEMSKSPFPVAYYAAYFNHNSDIMTMLKNYGEFTVTLGLCLPSSCDESEISNFLQSYFDKRLLGYLRIYNTTMKMDEVIKLDGNSEWINYPSAIALGIVLMVTLVLCILGTIHDVYFYKPVQDYGADKINIETCGKIELSPTYEILHCFSIQRNVNYIFSTKIEKDSVNCVYGVRFFSTLYVIIIHSFLFMKDFVYNLVYPFTITDRLAVRFFTTSQFAIDTFFCIGGYLLTYSYYCYADKNKHKGHSLGKKMNDLLNGIFKRFLRITPSYIMAMLITNVVWNWRHRTTHFWTYERNDLICPKYWWRNLLFINNLYPVEEMCMDWSWYLSNDMQYFILISFILVLSTVYLKAAAIMLLFIFSSCMIYTGYLTYAMNFIYTLNGLYVLRPYFYYSPLLRINAYIVGVFGGYIVYKCNKKLLLQKTTLWSIWTISLSLISYVIFGFGGYQTTLSGSIVFLMFSRIFWAISIVWLIMACETGHAGFLYNILTKKYWIPFSRISFWAYLINPVVVNLMLSLGQHSYEGDIHVNAILSPGFLLWTFVASFILTLMFESPTAGLIRVLVKHTGQKNLLKTQNNNIEKFFNENKNIFNEKND